MAGGKNRRNHSEEIITGGRKSDAARREDVSLNSAFDGVDWRDMFKNLGEFFDTIFSGVAHLFTDNPEKYGFEWKYKRLTGEYLNDPSKAPIYKKREALKESWEKADDRPRLFSRPDGSVVDAATGKKLTAGEARVIEEETTRQSMLDSVKRLEEARNKKPAPEDTEADPAPNTPKETKPTPVARMTEADIEATYAETVKFVSEREEKRNEVYADKLGKPTVGIGHLVLPEDNLKIGDVISDERVEQLFQQDGRAAFDAAKSQIKEIQAANPNFAVTPEFITVLTSVNFQMGTGWTAKFPNTWDDIKNGRYDQAIEKLEKSLWNTQTENRVDDFQNALRTQKETDTKAKLTAQADTNSPGGPSKLDTASADVTQQFDRARADGSAPEERELVAAATHDASGPTAT